VAGRVGSTAIAVTHLLGALGNPTFTARQVPPLSMLLKTPSLVPAYTVAGLDGSTAAAST
jgi:hypothetical protein